MSRGWFLIICGSRKRGELVLGDQVSGDQVPARTCVVQCLDWPIVAAFVRDPSLRDIAVVVRERIGARDVVRGASCAARALGVRIGMRRREAEACCADVQGVTNLVVLDVDTAHEARVFEAVARAIEQLTPRLELDVPGRLSFATRGPSRYFGGDELLRVEVMRVVCESLLMIDAQQVRVGIADGRFAARLAARMNRVIGPGESKGFVAPFPVAALADVELAGMLDRLGLATLGAFAALPTAAVLSRFGTHGARLHVLASGHDPAPLNLNLVPADCSATIELDPPVARVDAVAFAAKMLADRIVAQLADRGLACTRVLVEAETEYGEQLSRSWRHDDGFQPVALAERVRWQLDGWLQASTASNSLAVSDVRAYQDLAVMGESGLDSTTGALTRLRLEPEEVVAIPARQLGFFGGDPAAAMKADRVLSRVQGMLGYAAVGTMVQQGGRTPNEQIAFVPWGEPRVGTRPLCVNGEVPAWPGAVPGPYPARVFCPGIAARLVDCEGVAVRVSIRGEVVAWPHRLQCEVLPGGGGLIARCEGPWPSDVRWWDGSQHQRCVRWRIVMDSGVTVLASARTNAVTVDALYD